MIPNGRADVAHPRQPHAADGDPVAAAVDAHSPDVVLMDLRMPRVDGITATRRLRARPLPPEVIALLAHDANLA